MLYVLVLASITLMLGIFQFYSSIRHRGAVFLSAFLVIIPLAVVIYTAKDVIHTTQVNSQKAQDSALVKKESSIKDDKLEKIKKESQSSVAQASKANELDKNLTKSFKSFGSVNYNSNTKTYSVAASDSDTKKVFNQLIKSPSQVGSSNFSDIQDKLLDVSKTIKKQLGKGYTLELVQPDTTKPMLTFKDGKLTYSIFS